MVNLKGLSAGLLRRAALIQDRVEKLQSELETLFGPGESTTSSSRPQRRGRGSRRTMSPAAKARIAAAQRARWARIKSPSSPAASSPRGAKRKVSSAARAKMAAVARARWAKARAAGKTRL